MSNQVTAGRRYESPAGEKGTVVGFHDENGGRTVLFRFDSTGRIFHLVEVCFTGAVLSEAVFRPIGYVERRSGQRWRLDKERGEFLIGTLEERRGTSIMDIIEDWWSLVDVATNDGSGTGGRCFAERAWESTTGRTMTLLADASALSEIDRTLQPSSMLRWQAVSACGRPFVDDDEPRAKALVATHEIGCYRCAVIRIGWGSGRALGPTSGTTPEPPPIIRHDFTNPYLVDKLWNDRRCVACGHQQMFAPVSCTADPGWHDRIERLIAAEMGGDVAAAAPKCDNFTDLANDYDLLPDATEGR